MRLTDTWTHSLYMTVMYNLVAVYNYITVNSLPASFSIHFSV